MPGSPAATVPHAHADPDAALIARLLTALAETSVTTPPELLDLAATMQFTSQSKSSIYRGIAAGTFPASVATPSGPRWRRTKDLIPWINRLKT